LLRRNGVPSRSLRAPGSGRGWRGHLRWGSAGLGWRRTPCDILGADDTFAPSVPDHWEGHVYCCRRVLRGTLSLVKDGSMKYEGTQFNSFLLRTETFCDCGAPSCSHEGRWWGRSFALMHRITPPHRKWELQSTGAFRSSCMLPWWLLDDMRGQQSHVSGLEAPRDGRGFWGHGRQKGGMIQLREKVGVHWAAARHLPRTKTSNNYFFLANRAV
jgi:hypothetical protein